MALLVLTPGLRKRRSLEAGHPLAVSRPWGYGSGSSPSARVVGYHAGMNREAIQERLRTRPFEPFEIRLSNGDVHRVDNPEFVLVLRSNIIIGYPDSDRFAICSLLHVVSLQPVSDGQAAS
jgi:hypothetical protein